MPTLNLKPTHKPVRAYYESLCVLVLEKKHWRVWKSADMANLRRIDAVGENINNLTGLEFATNLRDLDLHRNQISDITALSGLTNLTS